VRDGRTGLLARADDPAALAAAVAAVLDDATLSARLAAAGRRHVREQFALQRLVDDVDALYRSLLGPRSG
jgi:glycosyltransferase involved in cell wall biosynthesis